MMRCLLVLLIFLASCSSDSSEVAEELEIPEGSCAFRTGAVSVGAPKWISMGNNTAALLQHLGEDGADYTDIGVGRDTVFITSDDRYRNTYYLAEVNSEWRLYEPLPRAQDSSFQGYYGNVSFVWQGRQLVVLQNNLWVRGDSTWDSLGVGCDIGRPYWNGEWGYVKDSAFFVTYCEGMDQLAVLDADSKEWETRPWILPKATGGGLLYLGNTWFWTDYNHAFVADSLGGTWNAMDCTRMVDVSGSNFVDLGGGLFFSADVSYSDGYMDALVFDVVRRVSFSIKVPETAENCLLQYEGTLGEYFVFGCRAFGMYGAWAVSVAEITEKIKAAHPYL